MALDYAMSAALMKNEGFRDRVKVACLKFADYITGEPITVPAHNTRLKWAAAVYRSPDSEAQALMPGVVMDPAVQQDGEATTDPVLQTAVEATVNKLL